MIIINADDWGRSRDETDAALSCYENGRITAVSAMVFMDDSERAAELGRNSGLDVGLHLNLTQEFAASIAPANLRNRQGRIVRFLTGKKYNFLIYNPMLRRHFRYSYQAQVEEFVRLYGKPPSHVDGHHHKHLCSNMLIDRIIPEGASVRRNFSFRPGEKSRLNRAYRSLVDGWLARRYRLTDYFFSLSSCLRGDSMMRVGEISRSFVVELMAHPSDGNEYRYLMSDDYSRWVSSLEKSSF